MAGFKAKTFPMRNHRIQVRFNNEHQSDDDAWRLIIEGNEYVVLSVKIESVVVTELFLKEGILKGNIITSGHPEIDDLGNAVIKKLE